MTDTTLKAWAEEQAGYTAKVRHALHRVPENGLEEYKTQAMIEAELTALGIPFTAVGTGIVATLKGTLPGPTIALRADIDALPIEENTGLPFSSEHPGWMHACGHDTHVAMLLGAAKLFVTHRDTLPGTVRFLFQPAEESAGGAERLIEAGCMDGVDKVYGIHIASQAPKGFVSTKPGPINAATDEIRITVLGKRGHGAHPPSGVDAIVITGQLITALQTLITREIEATDAVIFTIGTISGGTARNILCDQVKMEATLRTLTDKMRNHFQQRIPEFCEAFTRAMGGDCTVSIHPGYCACVNDDGETAHVLATARRLLGDKNVKVIKESSMGGEDFAYYLHHAPGCLYYVGSGCEHPLHNEHFAPSDLALPTGVLMHAALVYPHTKED